MACQVITVVCSCVHAFVPLYYWNIHFFLTKILNVLAALSLLPHEAAFRLPETCSREDGCLVLHKNGLNKPQRESGRCTSVSTSVISTMQDILLITEWCDAGSSAEGHSGLSAIIRCAASDDLFITGGNGDYWHWWVSHQPRTTCDGSGKIKA